jgi:hypothetical protein
MLRRCCHDGMTVKPFSMYKPGWCGFADLLHSATVGHTTRLFHCHVNIAVTFYCGRVKSVAPKRLILGTKFDHFRLATHDLQQLFPLYIFHILPNNSSPTAPTYGTLCITSERKVFDTEETTILILLCLQQNISHILFY